MANENTTVEGSEGTKTRKVQQNSSEAIGLVFSALCDRLEAAGVSKEDTRAHFKAAYKSVSKGLLPKHKIAVMEALDGLIGE